jgi:alkanesulfonate monooxygenase SsuD/methylene tetrahydromethanopterin reductase-like flavin-dependent oxidoreductase (luciferase family)
VVEVGLYFDLRNPPPWQQDWHRVYDFTLEVCEEADRLGIDSLWFTEHHMFEDGYIAEPLTFMAAVAARTKRARLGTAVVVAPLHSAIQIVEQAAVVDLISGGRLDLGLGSGYRVPEFELFGADLPSRYRSTDDRVREIRELLAAGTLTPPMVQRNLPIWMGYQGPKGARRAGKLGTGLLSCDPSLLAPYREGLADGDHDADSARMAGGLSAWTTDDPERDWSTVAEHVRWQVDSYRRHMVQGTELPEPKPIDPERIRAKGLSPGFTGILLAPPEEVARQVLAHIGDAPVQTVFFWASIAGMPEDMVRRHVRLIATELAPLLRSGSVVRDSAIS